MSTGVRIKELRKKKGWKQAELGKRVNVSSQVISNWEREYTAISHGDIIRLAEALETSTDYLLMKTDNPDGKSEDDEIQKSIIIDKIKAEFPDADLMFKDLASLTAEEMQEVYDFIKFKTTQKKNDS